MGRIAVVVSAVLVLSGCGGSSNDESSPTTQAVSVHLMSVASSGDALPLEKRVIAKITRAGVGEYDETNWHATDTGGEVELTAHGPDVDALWNAIKPVIRASGPKAGSYAIKIYGDELDPSAKRVRVDLTP